MGSSFRLFTSFVEEAETRERKKSRFALKDRGGGREKLSLAVRRCLI